MAESMNQSQLKFSVLSNRIRTLKMHARYSRLSLDAALRAGSIVARCGLSVSITSCSQPRLGRRSASRLFYVFSCVHHLSGNNRRDSHFMGS